MNGMLAHLFRLTLLAAGISPGDEESKQEFFQEPIIEPRGIANLGCDCFFNSLFQMVMTQGAEVQENLCQKHPIVRDFIAAYKENRPQPLHPLRALLANLSGESFWLNGEQDPHEAMLVLMQDVENPCWNQMVMKKVYVSPDDLISLESRERALITPLSIPENACQFDQLLERFRRSPVGDSILTREGIDYRLVEETASWEKPADQMMFQILRSSPAGVKIEIAIDIPELIVLKPDDFTERQEEPVTYQLVSLITHHGNQANGGHYTACVSYPAGSGDRRYFLCDDAQVSPLSKEQFLHAAQSAYILHFERTDHL